MFRLARFATLAISLIGIPVSLLLAFLYAPTEAVMGEVQRIFYFHMPSGISAYLGFTVSFGFSVTYLITNNLIHDQIAKSAAEVGLLFAAIVLVTGPLWARIAWGVYWVWDARLTLTLLTFLIFASYMLLRRYIEDQHTKAKISAVFATIGFAMVPLGYISIKIMNTMHPTLTRDSIEDRMYFTLMVSLFSILAFAIHLILLRSGDAIADSRLESIELERS